MASSKLRSETSIIIRLLSRYPSSQRLRAFLQDREVAVVREDAVALPARELPRDGEPGQDSHARGGGGEGEPGPRPDLREGGHGTRLQRAVDPERRARQAPLGLDALPILPEQRHQPPGSGDRAVRRLANPLQEEAEPRL